MGYGCSRRNGCTYFFMGLLAPIARVLSKAQKAVVCADPASSFARNVPDDFNIELSTKAAGERLEQHVEG
jgi:hypothetical protein